MKYWLQLSDKIRFFIVGAFNAGVSYFIYSLVVFFLGASYYQTALALAWVISSVVSFNMQRNFVFHSKGNVIKEYFKCCTTWVFSYIINACLLEFFVKKILINVYIAQILATLISAVFTYIMFKKFAFRKTSKID